MRTFFVIVAIGLVGFIIWCRYTRQPRETNMLNFASLTMAVMLIRQHSKKQT